MSHCYLLTHGFKMSNLYEKLENGLYVLWYILVPTADLGGIEYVLEELSFKETFVIIVTIIFAVSIL